MLDQKNTRTLYELEPLTDQKLQAMLKYEDRRTDISQT